MTTADLAHAAEDVRRHLDLRSHAVNDGTIDNPDVIEAVWHGGEGHALTDTVLRTLLAERDELVKRVAEMSAAFGPAGFISMDLSDVSLEEIEEWRERFQAAMASGARAELVEMPPTAFVLRRRTPEARRAYLTEHRDEAVARGIPGDLIDIMIAEDESCPCGCLPGQPCGCDTDCDCTGYGDGEHCTVCDIDEDELAEGVAQAWHNPDGAA